MPEGIAQTSPEPTIELEPVLHAGEICLNASWTYTGTEKIEQFRFARAQQDMPTADVRVLAEDTDRNTTVATPHTAPPLRDCLPGADRIAFVYVLTLELEGNASTSATQTAYRPLAPAAPTGPTYVPPAENLRVGQLTWTAPPDRAASGYLPLTGYDIEFRIGTSTIWHAAAPPHTGTDATYEDPTAWTRGTVLHFRVRATNAATALLPTAPGAWGTVTVTRPGPGPAAVPLTATVSTVQVDAVTVSPVHLAWAAPTEPVLGYHLYRFPVTEPAVPPGLGAAPLAANLASTVLTYEDATMLPAATYEYRLQAYDVHGGGPLSAPVPVEFVASPPPPTASPTTDVQLVRFAGGDVSSTLPAILHAGEVHTITVLPTAAMGTTTPYRYGGGQRGFALDAGVNGWMRWVVPDRLGECVDVTLCALRPVGREYGTYPPDGRASRWLAIWRGGDTRDGFGADTPLQLYVPPTLPTARSVTFGFAQTPEDGGLPLWLTTPGATVTVAVQPAARITAFTVTPLAPIRAQLTWTVAGTPPSGFQLQRRLADAGPETFTTVCCDLAPTVRAWVESPPPSDPPGMAVEYVYRIGAYVADSLHWFPRAVRVTVGPDAAVTTTTAPSRLLHFPALAAPFTFAAGADVTQDLPAAVGGTAPVTYTAIAPRAVGLRVDVDATPPRLLGAAWIGAAAGTLRATDASGTVAELTFHVVVGDPPMAPTGLTATGGMQQVTLAWLPPADATDVTGYRIEQVVDGTEDVWTVVLADTGNPSTTYVHAGLIGGRTVHYRVAAINASGPGAFSLPAHASTAAILPPGPPTAVQVTSGGGRLTLTWRPPTDDGGSRITDYSIQRSLISPNGPWSELQDAQGDGLRVTPAWQMSHTDTDLWPTRIVFYRVRAHSAHEVLGVSAAVHGLPEFMQKASAPVWRTPDITSGNGYLELRWAPSEAPGDAPIDYYQIEQSPDGTAGSWSVVTRVEGGRMDYTYKHAGRQNRPTIHYRIAALSAAGLGTYSEVRSGQANAAAPGPPSSVAAIAGKQGINVRWREPDDDGGSPITKWELGTSNDGQAWQPRRTLNSFQPQNVWDTTVTAGQLSYYRVRAFNSVGWGSWSDAASAVGLNGEPTEAPRPVFRGIPTANQACFDVTRNAAWSPAADQFRMEYSTSGYPAAWRPLATQSYDTNQRTRSLCLQHYRITVEGQTTEIATGATGHFRVRFGNSIGFGPPSTTVTLDRPAVPGNPPTALTAVVRGGAVDLRWGRPTPQPNTQLTGYRIEQSTDAGNTWTTAVADRLFVRLRHTVTDLMAMQTYHFRVVGSYVHRPGLPTPPVVVTAVLSGWPDPPHQLSATGGEHRIDLRWAAPLATRGATITGYRVERAGTRDAATWAGIKVEGADTLTHTQMDIAPGVQLYFRVVTRSNRGDSLTSNVIAARAISTPLAKPTGLVAFPGRTAILLEWETPEHSGHPPIEGYRIDWRTTEAEPWAGLVTHSGTTHTRFLHTGLAAGKTVHYQVAAIDVNGVGAAADHVEATTGADLPGPPRQVTATMRGNAAVLQWLPPTTGEPIVGYRVDRSPVDVAAWAPVAADTGTATTTYTDTSVTAGDHVRYRVFAHNAAGMGRPTDFVVVTATPTWPLPPTQVRVTSDFFRNTLAWTAVPTDRSAPVTDYRIEQAPHADGPHWFPVTTVPATAPPRHIHNGIPDGATVHYRIVAVSTLGESQPSTPVHSMLPRAATLLDVNGMDGFTVEDVLMLYYSRTFPTVLGDGSGNSGYAQLRQTLLAPNMSAISDSTLQAGVAATHRMARDHRQSRLDLNGDDRVDGADALLLYYAHEFRTELGDGQTAADGSATLRCTLLGGLTAGECEDGRLQLLLREANIFWGD